MDEWKPLILLVEDDEQILRPNQRMLKRRGYDVLAAVNAQEPAPFSQSIHPT